MHKADPDFGIRLRTRDFLRKICFNNVSVNHFLEIKILTVNTI